MARLRLSSLFETNVDILLTNNVTESIRLVPGNWEWLNTWFEGVKRIIWQGKDGLMYQLDLDVNAMDSWGDMKHMDIQIQKDNEICYGQHNTMPKHVQGTIIENQGKRT